MTIARVCIIVLGILLVISQFQIRALRTTLDAANNALDGGIAAMTEAQSSMTLSIEALTVSNAALKACRGDADASSIDTEVDDISEPGGGLVYFTTTESGSQ